jgi:hypothetical protein
MTLPAPNARKHDFGTRCGSLRLSHDPMYPFPCVGGTGASGDDERLKAQLTRVGSRTRVAVASPATDAVALRYNFGTTEREKKRYAAP